MPTDRSAMPYRNCVGILVLNADGLVWTGRRKAKTMSPRLEENRPWQMPQGGIDAGEKPFDAALRELYEETGMRTVELIEEAPDWFSYDLPDALLGKGLKGRYRGQKQKWFAFRFTGSDSEIAIDPPPDGHSPEFDAWQWRHLETLPELIVAFKRDLYRDVVGHFAHLAAPKPDSA